MRLPTSGLPGRIGDILAVDPAADAIEFEGSWRTWGQLADTVAQAAALVERPGAEVGVLLRNRPASVGLLLGVLRAGGCVVTINPGRGRDRTRDDIAALDLAVVAGEPADLAAFVPEGARATTAAVEDLGTPLRRRARYRATPAAVRLGKARDGGAHADERDDGPAQAGRSDLPHARAGAGRGQALRVQPGRLHPPASRRRHRQLAARAPRRPLPGAAVRQRRPALLPARALQRRGMGGRRAPPPPGDGEPGAHRAAHGARVRPRPCRPVQHPFRGLGYRPARSRTTPTPSWPGTASRYSSPTRPPSSAGVSPAGTSRTTASFWGGQAGQRRAGPRRLRTACRRPARPVSPSRPTPKGCWRSRPASSATTGGCARRIVARLDADGFLFILGRADQAIIRGGFKVRPDDIRAALERHPGVRGAAVVSRADRRLGAVPVAAVELRGGAALRGPDELLDVRLHRPRPLRVAGGDPHRRRPAPHGVGQGRPRRGHGAVRLDTGGQRPDAEGVGTGATRDGDQSGAPDDGPALLGGRRGLPRGAPRLVRPRGARRRPPAPSRRLGGPARYDTGWQRALHDAGYAGLNWPVEYGGRGLPASQQLVYLEEYAGLRRYQLRRERPMPVPP